MIKVLKNRNIDKESKKAKIEDIFKPGFDFSLMSKLSLGRESWTAMTNEDQEKFVGLFTKVFRQAYLDKILKYVDEEVIFEESRQDGKKVYVQSFIVSRDKKTSVLYKFYQSGPGWKIYDVEIEGISYIQTYRSQFTESLKEITVEELMVKMEKLISSQ
jgi:phospholipid transport system substrate-binding protein